MPPNVLVVVLDAARRDALEPYGAPAGSTPTIAQLASRGTAHSQVYSTACWTVPSHSSIFTGLMPRAAGLAQVQTPEEAEPLVRAHRDRLLPEVLRKVGYRSLAASANLWVSADSGFDTGFDHFEQIDSGRHTKMHELGPLRTLLWVAEGSWGRVDDGARDVERVLERLLVPTQQPLFCFVNLLECHSPYLPPRPYGRVTLLDRIRAADDARRYFRLEEIWRTNSGATRVPEPVLARSRRMYAAAIRYMDDWLGRVLERLDATGALDNTLVIVTSDHGENLGEGGLISHGLSLDNRLIHVPFVAAGPGSEGTLSSLASLPRYVAEVAGVRDHPYDDEPPAGYGVAQFDPPMSAEDEETVGHIRRAGLEDRLEVFTTPLTCAVAEDLKLLRRGEREEIYDLSSDPLELRPVEPGAVSSEKLAGLREALEHPALTARSELAPAPARPAASADEVRDLEDRMKLLGYM